jgi:hypothetical protein
VNRETRPAENVTHIAAKKFVKFPEKAAWLIAQETVYPKIP